MPSNGSSAGSSGGNAAIFATTHWSVVLAAGQSQSLQAGEALEKLCRAYWYPLYVYVRRRGHSPEDAADLTQEFFARFLAKDYFRLADPARGRFRTFLLNALQHFLINEWKRNRHVLPTVAFPGEWLDVKDAEHRWALEPVDSNTPERAYEKRWAAALLNCALAQLQQEYACAGKNELFTALKDFLWGRDTAMSYAELSQKLDLSENAIGVAVHRLRERYREHLRAEVTQTLSNAAEVDDELHYLIAIVCQTD
jgi:RNA polymerase sigma factor (sigma-70 family)